MGDIWGFHSGVNLEADLLGFYDVWFVGIKSRDNSVGTATDYALDDRMIGVRFQGGLEVFSSTPCPDWL
jgi:hypothetical protein